MAGTRKTIDRAALVGALNRALGTEATLTADQRRLLASFVEGVLIDGSAYRGFGYQRSEFNPDTADGQFGGLRAEHDESRRIYY